MREIQADAIVVGAGPAGLGCAAGLLESGWRVRIVDEQPAAGGQLLRGASAGAPASAWGRALLDAGASGGAVLMSETTVFGMTSDGELAAVGPDGPCLLHASAVVLATGSQERPVPVPGWTLPGAVSVGALQALMKGAGVVPDVPYVMVGAGPLLLLTAAQLHDAGAPPLAVISTMARGDLLARFPALAGLVADPALALQGTALLAGLARRRIRVFGLNSKIGVRILGQSRVEGVEIVQDGRARSIEASLVALHDGVVPNLHLAASLGFPLHWSDASRCFLPERRSITHASGVEIHVVGDAAGIRGGLNAMRAGRRLATRLCGRSGRPAPFEDHGLRVRIARACLDKVFAPTVGLTMATPETVVCRCEGTPLGDILASLDEGAATLAEVKTATRCGMGVCQGRQCALSVCELLVRRGRVPSPTRTSAPAKPLDLHRLADFAKETHETNPFDG